MRLLISYTPSANRRGFTIMETIIASALLILLSLITVQGMILHARSSKSNITQSGFGEQARRIVDAMSINALDATSIEVENGAAGNGSVLTIQKPSPANPALLVTNQYEFMDADSNGNTIVNNTLVERTTDAPGATGKVIARLVSRVPSATATPNPVFRILPGTARPLVQVQMRIGDRLSTGTGTSATTIATDNAQTGRGFQSFLVNAFISQE